MGVDINFYIEQKKEGKWIKVDFPETLMPWGRDVYMQGIFGQGLYATDFTQSHISSHPRGWPEDTSYDNKDDIDSGKFGYTFAYLDELMQINWDFKEKFDEDEEGNIPESSEEEIYPLRKSYLRVWVEQLIYRFLDTCNELEYRDIRIIVYFDC